MADEITFSCSLSINKKSSNTQLIKYGRNSSHKDDLTLAKGPSPGAITANLASAGGTQVSFSQLTRPTYCWISNLGPSDGDAPVAADYFEVGIWNAQDTSFHPLMEVGPGESYCIKLSRNLQEIYQGPGTGTSGAGETARLMLLANNQAQNALVEAFEA